MNRDRLLKDLDQVNRLIVRGEENIARQQQIITDLTERGHATYANEARRLLATFEGLQKQHFDHRDKLLRELEDIPAQHPDTHNHIGSTQSRSVRSAIDRWKSKRPR